MGYPEFTGDNDFSLWEVKMQEILIQWGCVNAMMLIMMSHAYNTWDYGKGAKCGGDAGKVGVIVYDQVTGS